MLLVALPLMTVLALMLTATATTSLSSSARAKDQAIAQALALRVEGWLGERVGDLYLLAEQAPVPLEREPAAALLDGAGALTDFSSITITDPDGTVVASSDPGASLAVDDEPWFATALDGRASVSTPAALGGEIIWAVSQPILAPGGTVRGVVVGDLDPRALADVLGVTASEAGVEIVVLDRDGRLVFDTERFADAAEDRALLAAGALESTSGTDALREAARSGAGSARFVDADGQDVIGGYDLVDAVDGTDVDAALDWVLVVQDRASEVLAPVARLRERAFVVVGIAALLAAVAALVVGSREARSLRSLADETSAAGVGVNSAAAQLSASSEELAATTTQQSAAVTQATATTEELARASAAIAETADEVARQTADTRDNLEQAESDITASSERTLALVDRVNDIDRLRGLINDIADQTNLLALNAAIEAARAGEHGLGFAVVADEVRRLAERSKASASEIAQIVTAVQGETNATVLAMEKGAKQMHHGLTLLAAVTDAAGQVRLTTHQQRSANAQVVETMEQLTQSSRQVSATAKQIADAAGDLADLASTLETTAASARDRY